LSIRGIKEVESRAESRSGVCRYLIARCQEKRASAKRFRVSRLRNELNKRFLVDSSEVSQKFDNRRNTTIDAERLDGVLVKSTKVDLVFGYVSP
jgi:hypothetical protein